MLGTWVFFLFVCLFWIWDIFIIWKTVLRIYKISSVSGTLKIKHWPWDYLALILNLFTLEHSQFLELYVYEDTRRWIPFCICGYSEPFIHWKLGSSCVHHVLRYLHQNQSTLISFYVLSFSELNDCKTLQIGFLPPLWLIKLRTKLVAHTRKDRNACMLTRTPRKRLVIQNSTFI